MARNSQAANNIEHLVENSLPNTRSAADAAAVMAEIMQTLADHLRTTDDADLVEYTFGAVADYLKETE